MKDDRTEREKDGPVIGARTPAACRLIVLGAGRPFRGEQHTALRGMAPHSRVLDWLVHAVAFLEPEVHFVGGYQIEEVSRRYPQLRYTVNPEWQATGAAVSLLEAPLDGKVDQYATYADILFRERTVRQMAETHADIVVAIDSAWRGRFAGRSEHDIARCEKVIVADGVVLRLGADIDPQFANAEFVGLVRFTPQSVEHICKQSDILRSSLRQAHLAQLIELLRAQGWRVAAVDVAGDWAELNESRDLARFILGTKAQTLRRLRGLVRQSTIEDQVSFTVSEWRTAADAVRARIAGAFEGHLLAVRSSALSEDSFLSANAGVYMSVLNVDGSDCTALDRSIESVIDSYGDANGAHEVLVQPMVRNVRASGVAFTRTLAYGAPYYVINYDDVDHSTTSITSGTSHMHKTLIVHRDAKACSERIPDEVRGLLPALDEIEQLVDYDYLDVEFAIGGEGRVHVLQVRPVAVEQGHWDVSDEDVRALVNEARERFRALQPPSPFVAGRRAFFGVMPDWNPAEIVGSTPGQLALELYRYLIMDECWAAQRAEYGYRDVRPHPLLVCFAGRPYVDIRASFSSFVPAGLDDDLAGRLVDFYLDWLEANPHLHDKVEFEVVPTCYSLNFERWERRLIDQGGFTSGEVARLRDELMVITRRALGRNRVDLDSVATLDGRFERILGADLEPLERATLLLEDCRRYGTLAFSHLARSAFVAVTLLRSAVEKGIISREARDVFLNTVRTVAHRFTEDAASVGDGGMTWEGFVARYGHLRPGTYDITSPAYAADPEYFLRPIIERARGRTLEAMDDAAWRAERPELATAVARAGLADDFVQVESFMREAIEGREYAKFVFTRNLSAALECLARFGEEHGLRREELADIPLSAFYALRTGSQSAADTGRWLRSLAREGGRQRHLAGVVEMPPLLFVEEDLTIFLYPPSQPNFICAGRVTAGCVDLSSADAPRSLSLAGKIVLVPSADPGYDWLFGQDIGGLITMYGGANSHMAIRAAEFGLPAAIGIGETQYALLARASVIELDAGGRRIHIIR